MVPAVDKLLAFKALMDKRGGGWRGENTANLLSRHHSEILQQTCCCLAEFSATGCV